MRNDVHLAPAGMNRKIISGDILIIEAEAEPLAKALSSLGLELEEVKTAESEAKRLTPEMRIALLINN